MEKMNSFLSSLHPLYVLHGKKRRATEMKQAGFHEILCFPWFLLIPSLRFLNLVPIRKVVMGRTWSLRSPRPASVILG